MLSKKKDSFLDLKNDVSKKKKIINEINTLSEDVKRKENSEDKEIILDQIKSLKNALLKINSNASKTLDKISAIKSLPSKEYIPVKIETTSKPLSENEFSLKKISKSEKKDFKLSRIEKLTLKRLKKKEKKVKKKKEKKPNKYFEISNKLFSNVSMGLAKKKMFTNLEIDLVKANMNLLLRSYISVIFFTTLISFIVAIFIFIFFLFFSIGAAFPIITLSSEGILTRMLKMFWILLLFPVTTFMFMYFYPSLEKDSLGKKVDLELPFATINMAAISSSLVDPSKIFSIILITKEYPNLDREFTKLLNSMNVLGQDLVTALKNSSINTASRKLSELFNGLATTINSGGDLPGFFDERAKGLLFDYHIEREKSTKSAETFMDIYISVVIAAPMILMLLLMMMRISGLGIPISTNIITLIMILGVVGINIGFLTFLHLKQGSSA